MTRPAPGTGPAPAGMLTIGQLAGYAGVTARAIRHYHQRGLLAEPARDSSGYRRYGAQAVLDLIRIKILAEAGVPLARINELLSASPGQLAESAAEISADLQRQIRELQRRRRRIADLADGERMFLPAGLAGFLDELRAAGVGARAVQVERDGWILLLARYPERALEWLERKRADLADPEYQQLYRGYDEAAGWDPADPRLDELADAMVSYLIDRYPGQGDVPDLKIDDPAVAALLTSYFSDASSPSLERLNQLAGRKLEGRKPGGHGGTGGR
jgi:DNA-binding transcriptional MerR regulator